MPFHCPNAIKLFKYVIKTVLENNRCIRNIANIPKIVSKSAWWVSQAFSGTKDETKKFSKSKAYCLYVNL